MQFPTRARLEIDVPPLLPGISGLVQAIANSATVQGAEVDLDEWICASSAPFATYAFDQALNLYHDGKRASAEAEWFTSYGVFEGIGYFTGWHAKDFNHLSIDDLWKVVQFEIVSGRPLVSIGFGGEGVVQVVGFEASASAYRVDVTDGVNEWQFDVLNSRPQHDSETFVNFVVGVRAGDVGLMSKERQIAAVLRWGAEHLHALKEFVHETRENYAPGLAGAEVMLRLAQDGVEPQIFKRHVASRRRSREAAARVLPRWAELIGEPALVQVGAEYEKIAQTLGPDPHAYEAALHHERVAAQLLASVASRLPSAFG
ncbi:MAG: hypothetical protein R3E66_10385 [bacterium]